MLRILVSLKHSYIQQSSPGQTEGLKGRLKGWVCASHTVGWVDGFAKVDNRFGYEKWIQGGCIGLN